VGGAVEDIALEAGQVQGLVQVGLHLHLPGVAPEVVVVPA
jgi:hypothetical protein